jgi:hypothetical protein
MLYLGTGSDPAVVDLLDRGRIGLMCRPEANRPRAGWIWAADNGCYSKSWDLELWRRWIDTPRPRAGCLFAVVPDVVGDWARTLDSFARYRDDVRAARYPVAIALQDGATADTVPWHMIDAVFVGGTTEWKHGAAAHALAHEAARRGLWVHVGRINSQRAYLAWAADGASCDGTYLAYGPRRNVPRLLRWLAFHDRNPQLVFR